MLQLNTLVRFIHSHSPARLSKFKKILARRPKSVPTPVLDQSQCRAKIQTMARLHTHSDKVQNMAVLVNNVSFAYSPGR